MRILCIVLLILGVMEVRAAAHYSPANATAFVDVAREPPPSPHLLS
jgi:hypothetical protein